MPVGIKLMGQASGKNTKFEKIQDDERNLSLMDYLRKQNIPIASACYGEGVCKKCIVNDELLSCQIKVKDCLKSLPRDQVDNCFVIFCNPRV
jgi:hypothetical protein